MKVRTLLMLALTLLVACSAPEPAAEAVPQAAAEPIENTDRWEEAMLAFEAADRENPPATGGIVFIGSSSFRRWDLEKSFPGMGLINRGFGGSMMVDAIRYVDRIVLPLEPRTVFLYEGDNDIGNGKTPETVVAEYKTFVAKVHDALPETKIVFVAIKPSIRRWALIETMRDANARIRGITEDDPRLEYIDTDTPALGPNGEPRPELFVEDNLHLTDAGYAIWADLVRPHLD